MTRTAETIWFDDIATPIGRLRLVADVQGLREVWFETGKSKRSAAPHWQHDPERLHFARHQLDDYFAGQRQSFDLPLHPIGTTFQLQVWQALEAIPYGTTVSYAEIARRIGQPQAVRAVGAANGRNPIPIVVPCHRVIGSDGSLTGFGGGLPTKRFLLALEEGITHGDLFAPAVTGPTAVRH